MPDEQDIKIAILEKEVAGLRELYSVQREEIRQSLREVADEFFDSIKEIHSDIKSIYEFINQSKGGIAALMFSASAVGGVVVAVVSWGLTKFLH
jgi:hypothetical protein